MRTIAGLAEKIGTAPLAAAWYGNVQRYRRCRDEALQAVKSLGPPKQ